jgi:hypothetical protein
MFAHKGRQEIFQEFFPRIENQTEEFFDWKKDTCILLEGKVARNGNAEAIGFDLYFQVLSIPPRENKVQKPVLWTKSLARISFSFKLN